VNFPASFDPGSLMEWHRHWPRKVWESADTNLRRQFAQAFLSASPIRDVLPVKYRGAVLTELDVVCNCCEQPVQSASVRGFLQEHESWTEVRGFAHCQPCLRVIYWIVRINGQGGIQMRVGTDGDWTLLPVENT